MRKYYRIVDNAPNTLVNVDNIIKMGGVHYSTIHGENLTLRFFVAHLEEDEVIVAKLSLDNVSFDTLNEREINQLKVTGYIK